MPKIVTCTSRLNDKVLYVFVQEPDGVVAYAAQEAPAKTATNALKGETLDDAARRFGGGYVGTKAEDVDDDELAKRLDGMVRGAPKK